jgi:DNA-binding PadR family transcriptional regulator
VYRALRVLEERQAVSSYWHRSSSGPARHMYRLTPVGDVQLQASVETATEIHSAIQRYFGRYAAAGSRPPEPDDRDGPPVSPPG